MSRSNQIIERAIILLRDYGHDPHNYYRPGVGYSVFGAIDTAYQQLGLRFSDRNEAIRRIGMEMGVKVGVPWYRPFKRRHAEYEASFVKLGQLDGTGFHYMMVFLSDLCDFYWKRW